MSRSGEVVKTGGMQQYQLQFVGPKYVVREMGNSVVPTPETTTDYLVASRTDWMKSYRVTVGDTSKYPKACSCPDFQHRGGICKHMRQVINFGVVGLTLADKPVKPIQGVPVGQPVQPVTVVPIAQRWINVKSDTHWAKSYSVGLDQRDFPISCTCPSFEHRQSPCKHMTRLHNKRLAYGKL